MTMPRFTEPPKPETYDMPALACLACERRLDAATEVASRGAPTPGRSLSVCAYCSHLTMFDADDQGRLFLRHCTDEELASIEQDPHAPMDLAKALRVTRRFQAMNN